MSEVNETDEGLYQNFLFRGIAKKLDFHLNCADYNKKMVYSGWNGIKFRVTVPLVVIFEKIMRFPLLTFLITISVLVAFVSETAFSAENFVENSDFYAISPQVEDLDTDLSVPSLEDELELSLKSEGEIEAKFSETELSDLPEPPKFAENPAFPNINANVGQNVTPENQPLIIAVAESADVVRESLMSQTPTAEERDRLREELVEQSKILQAQANVLKLVSKIIEPSVVHIKADMVKRGPHGERISFHDEGSGIIISRNDKYYILTNFHVIRESLPENIDIQLYDNRITHPIHVWSDIETDIAVLEMGEKDLVPATIGDSNAMDIGDFVLAVGSPFGLDRSVTFGIISAKGRRAINIDANVNLQDFIQTDAAINPGNSGGPLVNLRAEVIAMNTAIASNSGTNAGIAFSIPIRMVVLIADQLIVYGKARRAYLGVSLQTEFTIHQAKRLGLENNLGACVTEVQPGSPAAKANFSKDDVILKFNNITVEDDKHLYNLVNLADINQTIPVTVFRKGKVYNISIKLLER